ncbi:MAG: methionine--tRNA ligase [Candidatus Harrisonbacteria bacterium]|nr:methionine--tRNA ligase [Candidatus Harrisonbacteria bacterium]
MPTITIDQFLLSDLRIGRVKECKEVEGSEKLLRLLVDFGAKEAGGLGDRVIFSGIKKWYTPDSLLGKNVVAIVNLAPRKMMGEESWGMVLATDTMEGAVAILECPSATPGSKVR